MAQWYELRVVGSAGTTAAITGGSGEGIAIAENGRLCSIASGQAKKFDNKQQAIEFLNKTSIPGIYNFEPVPVAPAHPPNPAH